ncbi:MAG: flagellar hook assembly protein FlgD [Granulosicoccus sp.]
MTTITPAALEKYQFDKQEQNNFTKELGQGEFLELMMAQLENQDPMKPMDNGEFLGQMAQFSTVSGIEGMQESLEKLTETYATSQTLQSTALVGQEVLIEDKNFELNTDETVNGSFELEAASGDVKLDISDSSGAIVHQLNLGEYGPGRHAFTWDGKDSQGDRLSPGKYSATVTVKKDDGYEAVTVLSSRVIDSVEFGAGNQSTLNTLQGDVLTMADIRQIRNVNPVRSTQQ